MTKNNTLLVALLCFLTGLCLHEALYAIPYALPTTIMATMLLVMLGVPVYFLCTIRAHSTPVGDFLLCFLVALVSLWGGLIL